MPLAAERYAGRLMLLGEWEWRTWEHATGMATIPIIRALAVHALARYGPSPMESGPYNSLVSWLRKCENKYTRKEMHQRPIGGPTHFL